MPSYFDERESDFRSLTRGAFIFIRFIMTALMNAHMLLRILEIENSLDEFSTFHAPRSG